MSSDLLNLFTEKTPRENSGSRSANRFDYQKNWSLCELLSLHSKKDDYLMVFEHHEDVVVLDSQYTPSSAIFYQIKTKKPGNWTIGSLSKTDKNGQSIIGKLYSNFEHFSDCVEKLVFSSNQGLSAKLANGDIGLNCQLINFNQLSNKDKEKIRDAAEGSAKLYCDIHGLSKITTHKTDLRLADHTAITKGKLVEFFEREYPESSVHISLVYKSIFDEIRRRTNYELPCTNSDELVEKKAISQSEFEGMVGTVLTGRTANELWADANQLLSAEGYKALEIRNLRVYWQKYIVDRMNVTDESLVKLQEEIDVALSDVESSSLDLSIQDILDKMLKRIRKSNYFDWYDDSYIEAAIMYGVVKDDSVPKANKKSKEEAK